MRGRLLFSALVLGLTGLALVLAFAFALGLDPGTAAGLAAGSLTQSSVIGTASTSSFNVRSVPGQNQVTFTPVPPNSRVPGGNTFSVLVAAKPHKNFRDTAVNIVNTKIRAQFRA